MKKLRNRPVWRTLYLPMVFLIVCWDVQAQNIAINTSGAAAAAANLLEVTQPATAPTDYVSIFAKNLSTGVNAYAIWAEATGATNKYAIVVPNGGGRVGLGTITPTEILDVNGNINIPLSTTTVGVIKSNGDRYIHNFGTENFFAGVLAGNLTQSGTGNTGVGYQVFKDATSSYGSTFFGAYSGWKITSGAQNTGFGHSAFGNATTQGGSTAVGYESQQNNGGQYTSSLGHRSLKNNTADYITGVGASALENNTGINNTAVGYNGLKNNSSGSNNTSLGSQALEDNTTTSGNTAMGTLALWKNTGTENTGLGYNVMNLKILGNYNVAVGSEAMSLNSGQDESVAVGYRSNLSNTGDYNTSIGAYTLAANTSPASNNNTALGHSALRSVTTGAGNTGIGTDAGFAGTPITTGSNNTFIGYGAQASSASLTNATAIGYNASVAISNALILGNGANVGIGTSSPAGKLEVVNTSGGTTASNYLQITGTITDNLNYPALSFKGGNLATTYPGIFLTNGGLALNFTSGSSGVYTNKMFIDVDAGASWIRFGVNGAPLAVLSSAGYLGIGVTPPAAKLDVQGTSGTTVKIVDGNQGAGKVLTSDASGVASWSNGPYASGSGNSVLLYNDETDATGNSATTNVKTYVVAGTYTKVKTEVDIEWNFNGAGNGFTYSILYNGSTVRTATLAATTSAAGSGLSGYMSHIGAITNGQTISIDIPSKIGVNAGSVYHVKGFRVYGIY